MHSNNGKAACDSASSATTNATRAARRLRKRGFAICKINAADKKPANKKWSTHSLEPGDFGPTDLIGIMGGPLSDGGKAGCALIILDLDAKSIVSNADKYLPRTEMIEGRKGKPRSHRYYLVPLNSIPEAEYSSATQAAPAAMIAKNHPGPRTKSFRIDDGSELLRMIGTGGQAVCPPSKHPSGELREWEGDDGKPGTPFVVAYRQLRAAVEKLATACGWSQKGSSSSTVKSIPAKDGKSKATALDHTLKERVIAYLDACPAAKSGEGGHDQLFRVAIAITNGFALSADDAFRLINVEYNPRCKPAWSEQELRHKIDDALALEHNKPRGHLRDPAKTRTAATDFLARHRARFPEPLDDEVRVLNFFGGSFYEWTGRGAWREIDNVEMRAAVTRDMIRHSDTGKVSAREVTNVITMLQGLTLVDDGRRPLPFFISDFGPPTVTRNRHLLVLKNGAIDLGKVADGKDPKLLPHDPRWFTLTALPYEFIAGAKCPAFKHFLWRVLERDEKGKALVKGDRRRALLQEWFGYSLLGDARFQRFLLMLGDGANGKGVIQDLWTRMLGEPNVSHVGLDRLGERFALQALIGKSANIVGDMNDLDATAEGALKMLTGEDSLFVDRKYLPPITVAPTIKMIFASNSLPRFADKTNGVWRRLMVLPFRVIIPLEERDEQLAQKVSAELPGILNWAIRGLIRLLAKRRFTRCDMCTEAAVRHRRDCDPVAQFLDESGLHPVPDDRPRRIPQDELHRRYVEWCECGRFLPKSKNSFGRDLRRLAGVSEYRSPKADLNGKRPYYWTGLGTPLPLPPSIEEEEDDNDNQ